MGKDVAGKRHVQCHKHGRPVDCVGGEDILADQVHCLRPELRELISRDNPKADLDDIRGKYRKKVSEEFIEQSPSYSDSPEDSSEESDDDEDQEYHQHG